MYEVQNKKGGCMEKEKAAKIKENVKELFISLADSKRGQEFAAAIALEARISLSRREPTPTIVEFSKAFGISNPMYAAIKIVACMYPSDRHDMNPSRSWQEYDKAYYSRVVHSGWIFPVLKGGQYESQKNA